MALRVWLPLTGTLENKGCSGIVPTASNPSYTNGKIGQCYNGGDLTIATGYTFGKVWSFAFWGYVVGSQITSNWTLIARLNDGGTNLRIEVCPSSYSNGIYCYSTHNNSSYNITTGGVNSPTGGYYDQWAHFCLTSDGITITKYMNGNKIGTCSYNGSGQINGTFLLANNSKIYKNDVRIYDHCLSAAEVHEISQGLVLHYKLDGFQGGLGNPNLYTGSRDFSGTWVNGNIWTVASEIYQGFTVKQRSATWGGLCQNVPCTQNDIFTVSFYGKVDSGGNIQSVHRSNLGNVTTGLTILGGNFSSGNIWVQNGEDGTNWKRYWATVQITGSDVTYLQWRIENSVSGKNFYVCGMKLEKGSSHTGWSPAASEVSFNTIQDSSGYGHNGILNDATAKLSSDTVRYSAALLTSQANNSATYPIKGECNIPESSNLTFIWWMKPTTIGMQTSGIFSTSNNDAPTDYLSTAANMYDGVFQCCNTSGTYKSINVTNYLTTNEWHHYALTYNGATLTFYKDGVLKGTAAQTGALKAFKYIFPFYSKAGGVNRTTSGGLSDFRIYVTTLSAADILSLYNTAAKVDNLGNWHTFEFKENNGIAKITKMGITEANEVYDNMNFNNRAQIVKTNAKVLIAGDLNIVTTYSSSVKTGTMPSLPGATVQALAGKTLRFIYDVYAPGARYSAEQGQTAWNYTRYGIHGACTLDGSTNYPFANQLNYTGNGIHAIQTWTIPTGKSTYGDLGFSIQNFDKPSSTNNATWFIRNVRLELVEGTSENVTGTNLIEK